MFTSFSRTIDQNIALELTQELIKTTAQAAWEDLAMECVCDDWHGCSCQARDAQSSFSDEGIIYQPDYHSGRNTVTFPEPNTLLLTGNAGSGQHTLSINVATGELVVTHDGRRRSFPGNAQALLPDFWWELNRAEDWTLVEYRSSQPGWAAVAGFLSGKKGSGPENLEEWESFQAKKALSKLRTKAEAAHRRLPDTLTAQWDYQSQKPQYLETIGQLMTEYKVSWTGLEYRRAAANGVAL
jgi:hypothetical protein